LGKANAIYVTALDGAPARPLFAGFSKDFVSFRARWHPDGRRISVWGNHQTAGWSFWTSASDRWNPVRSEIASEVEHQLQTGEVTLADFNWSPAGNAIFFEGREGPVTNIWRVAVAPDTLRWQAASRLTTGAERNVNMSVSPDGGKLAFSVRNEQTRLWSLPFDPVSGRITGQGDSVLAEGADVAYDVSSDGRELVYRTLRRNTQELWRRSLSKGHSQLLISAQSLSVPRLSHDGTRVVFRRSRELPEGHAVEEDVVVMAATGGTPQLLTTPQRSSPGDLPTFVPFDWSADGTRILSPCRVQAYLGICMLSVSAAPRAEREMRVIASAPDRNVVQGQFSPNQKLICFNAVQRAHGRPAKSIIYVAPIAGGSWIAITTGDFWDDKARWSPDGRTIYYASLRNGFFNIWARRFDLEQGQPIGEPFRVTEFEGLEHSIYPDVGRLHIAVSNDRLTVPMTDVSATVWVLETTDR
jgi:Tol biopolymer transport system component